MYVFRASLITKRLNIAERAGNTPTSKLCSQGKIRYHLEKNGREFEGVFTRDNEIVHGDDDYETEVIKVGIFAQTNFQMRKIGFTFRITKWTKKDLLKSLCLVCTVFLKSQDQDLEIRDCCGARNRPDAAKVRGSTVNDRITTNEKGAFL